MSSIPAGRRRRKRRGHESNLCGDLLDKCIVFADMCRYPSVLMVGKSEGAGALGTCNNRYTVNLVIYLSWRKEADAQYLEAQTAGRLMFKANTPLRRVYSSLLHVFPPRSAASINIYNMAQLSVKSFSWPFISPWQHNMQTNKWKPNRTTEKKDRWRSLRWVCRPAAHACTRVFRSSHLHWFPPILIQIFGFIFPILWEFLRQSRKARPHKCSH